MTQQRTVDFIVQHYIGRMHYTGWIKQAIINN